MMNKSNGIAIGVNQKFSIYPQVKYSLHSQFIFIFIFNFLQWISRFNQNISSKFDTRTNIYTLNTRTKFRFDPQAVSKVMSAIFR